MWQLVSSVANVDLPNIAPIAATAALIPLVIIWSNCLLPLTSRVTIANLQENIR